MIIDYINERRDAVLNGEKTVAAVDELIALDKAEEEYTRLQERIATLEKDNLLSR